MHMSNIFLELNIIELDKWTDHLDIGILHLIRYKYVNYQSLDEYIVVYCFHCDSDLGSNWNLEDIDMILEPAAVYTSNGIINDLENQLKAIKNNTDFWIAYRDGFQHAIDSIKGRAKSYAKS